MRSQSSACDYLWASLFICIGWSSPISSIYNTPPCAFVTAPGLGWGIPVRLIAATTRQPNEIPAAIRSRCLEIYFRNLLPEEIVSVAKRAAVRVERDIDERALELISHYATNGREAVNIVQIAAGMTTTVEFH